MKVDNQPRKEARPLGPILLWILAALLLVGKLYNTDQAIQEDENYKREPVTTITGRP